jgi:hypothetical protein
MLDLERARSDLATATLDREHALSKAEKCERERDRAIDSAMKSKLSLETHQERIGKMEAEHEEKLAEIVVKSKDQLRKVREEYDAERSGLAMQVELLQNAKLGLQAEIGQLIRDRKINVYKF